VKKTITIMMGLALSATVAFAQDKPAVPAAPAAVSGDPVILTAGDVQVHKSEFEAALKTLPPEYQAYAQGQGKRQFADDFLRMKLLAAQGYKNGLDKDPEVLSQLKLMRENLVANAQLQKLDKSIVLSDADLLKVYDANKKDYEEVHARHILVAFKGSPAAPKDKPELTEEQAKAKAEDLRKQIVSGGDFAAIAKKESDDAGSGANGGDLGSFGHGQMVPEFEQAAFAAKPGDLTPVVRTQFGYHIIKVESHDFTSLDQVRPQLEKKERQAKMQASLDALKTAAKPVYSDDYFGAVPAATPATPAVPPATKKP
jgi:peptidyl-prolyl cis-trans isomerase C